MRNSLIYERKMTFVPSLCRIILFFHYLCSWCETQNGSHSIVLCEIKKFSANSNRLKSAQTDNFCVSLRRKWKIEFFSFPVLFVEIWTQFTLEFVRLTLMLFLFCVSQCFPLTWLVVPHSVRFRFAEDGASIGVSLAIVLEKLSVVKLRILLLSSHYLIERETEREKRQFKILCIIGQKRTISKAWCLHYSIQKKALVEMYNENDKRLKRQHILCCGCFTSSLFVLATKSLANPRKSLRLQKY